MGAHGQAHAPPMSRRRVVCYSLTFPTGTPRPDLLWQLEASVASLRTHNHDVSIVVFVHEPAPSDIAPRLERHGVRIVALPSYESRLIHLHARAAETLRDYPLLHKFLNFSEITALAPHQVLLLDCDTVFCGDVERLFDAYSDVHLAAREEPTSARSHYGYDPVYLDESALARVAAADGLRLPPPFNLGVVLLNHGVWAQLAGLASVLVDYAWRFQVWMAMNPASGATAEYGEGQGVERLRAHFDRLVPPLDVLRALPYPSANRWILDQMALWFTLGRLSGLTYRDFLRHDVIQNGEFTAPEAASRHWVVCHYFNQNMARIDAWLRGVAIDLESQLSTTR